MTPPVSTKKRAEADRAREISESCAIGDHNTISHQGLRGLLGLLMVAVNAAKNRTLPTAPVLPHADVVLLVSNPVAHGAVLVESVTKGVETLRLATVGDTRLSSTPLDAHFPSVSPTSIARLVTWSRLREAAALRRSLPTGTKLVGSSSRAYREYLFLSQAIRYRAIETAIDDLEPGTMLLADFDRSTFARPWIWAAKRRGIHTATLFHGSPNLTHYLPVLADFALTWGSVQAAWLERHDPDVTSIVVGRPDITTESRSKTANPSRLVLCHSREELSGAEASALASMARQFSDRGLPTLLRLHPTTALNDLSIEWQGVADSFDGIEVGRGPFLPSLRSGDLVACVASSAAVEAIAIDLDAVVVADEDRILPSDLEALRLATPGIIEDLFTSTGASASNEIASEIVAATGADARANLNNALVRIHRSA